MKGIESKAAQFAYNVNIKIVVSTPTPARSEMLLNNIANAFAQYDNGEKGNGFRLSRRRETRTISDFIFR